MVVEHSMTVVGRVGSDPELRFSPNGVAVGRFRLGSTERKFQDGEWRDGDTLWVTVTCFRDMAEHCVDSLVKGDQVIVVGHLQIDEWETKEGEKRVTPNLVADHIGPSLKFRVTPHSEQRRAERSRSKSEADPWASQPAAAEQSDDPPF